jgi:hypothetical protein
MITILSALISLLSFRVRSRASLELRLSRFGIKWPSCGGNAQVGFGFSAQTGSYERGYIGSRRAPCTRSC